jgi:hypothetical protein
MAAVGYNRATLKVCLHGTLAATRLDFDFHVWHGIRAVSGAVPAGLCMGERLDFLAGAGFE